jgi:hypothetical protein
VTTAPECFEIEIDRVGLLRYLRRQGLGWVVVFVAFGVFFGLVAVAEAMEKIHFGEPASEQWKIAISRIGMVLVSGSVLGWLAYWVFVHRGSRRAADGLRLRVDGMYLHIINEGLVRVDRKIHFNKVTDYAVIDGPVLRHCGIRALSITCDGARPNAVLVIPGVIDAERIRDLLCAIDRQREDRVG